MSRSAYIDYDENPYRLDPLTLKPLFRTSRRLKAEWFLAGKRFPTAQIVRAAYHHTIIRTFLPAAAPTYLEIGAGSGNLASFFFFYDRARIVVVDLPTTILYSAAYLMSIFPTATFQLPHELGGRVTSNDLQSDFTFIWPSQIDRLDSDTFDVAVNIASMQEMTWPQIEEYFRLVQRVCRVGALFCNENRVEKVPSKSERPIRAQEFPYDPRNEVIVSEVSRLSRLTSLDPSFLRVERVRKS
jgi:hypothetical protein